MGQNGSAHNGMDVRKVEGLIKLRHPRTEGEVKDLVDVSKLVFLLFQHVLYALPKCKLLFILYNFCHRHGRPQEYVQEENL